MVKIIASYKTTKDVTLRDRIARIYKYREMIYVMSGHPRFEEVRE